jgi:hypothetical protein
MIEWMKTRRERKARKLLDAYLCAEDRHEVTVRLSESAYRHMVEMAGDSGMPVSFMCKVYLESVAQVDAVRRESAGAPAEGAGR